MRAEVAAERGGSVGSLGDSEAKIAKLSAMRGQLDGVFKLFDKADLTPI